MEQNTPNLNVFKMPQSVKISGRTSTITNAFFNWIVPNVFPSELEVEAALKMLEMSYDKISCIYCGGHYDTWDHFHPLVNSAEPTGYISEIANLVPCCSKCNSSKNGKEWEVWINGTAPLSPKYSIL
jgi:hypothetical protein